MSIRFYLVSIILLSAIASNSYSQMPTMIINEITGDQYDGKYFTPSKLPLKQNAGIYHFGESEAEWDLICIPFKDSLIIQIQYGYWSENRDLNNLIWINKYQTYNTVKLEGNKFYFGDYSGQFVEYAEGSTKLKSVILFSDPIQGRNYLKDSAEVGFYNTSIDTFFDSKERHILSIEIKPESFFVNKSKQELKILRNTIFANYGLIFKKDGEMDKYFKKKEWYKPYIYDVSMYLTTIEQRNIETLLRFELP